MFEGNFFQNNRSIAKVNISANGVIKGQDRSLQVYTPDLSDFWIAQNYFLPIWQLVILPKQFKGPKALYAIFSSKNEFAEDEKISGKWRLFE